jgi:hypothetical protein
MDTTLDTDTAYTVAGYRGIAWSYDGPELADEYDPETGENVTEWSGYQVETGMVLCHMIGDDRTFVFAPDDLEPLAREDYCGECGQVGCAHDGYDR